MSRLDILDAMANALIFTYDVVAALDRVYISSESEGMTDNSDDVYKDIVYVKQRIISMVVDIEEKVERLSDIAREIH